MDLLESIKKRKINKPKSNKRTVGFVNVFVGEERLKETMKIASESGFSLAAFIRSLIDVLIEQEREKQNENDK